jgi:hypothetical protein
MALDRPDNLSSTGSQFELPDDARFADYETERERSHFGAFLMGGLVVTGGLLAFLYYDTDNLNRRANNNLTTGTILRGDVPTPVPTLRPAPPTENRGDVP